MRKLIFILIVFISFSNCKSSKRAKKQKPSTSKVIISPTNKETIVLKNKSSEIISDAMPMTKSQEIINYAKQFEGVHYKWGGTTKNGMDCSGLVYESFRAYNIILPRISRDMAKSGIEISLKNVEVGDLLFFKTKNRRNDINHVGLVVETTRNVVAFIHATTSNGVIISSLTEDYWNSAFVEARRIL